MLGKNGVHIRIQQEKSYHNVKLFYLGFEKVLKMQGSVIIAHISMRSLCTSLSHSLCILPSRSLSVSLSCSVGASLLRCPLNLVMIVVVEKYAMSPSRRLACNSPILALRIACVAGLTSVFLSFDEFLRH